MAVWTEVLYSHLSDEHRSDAEFFKPEYIKLDAELDRIPEIERLGTLSLFVKKGIFDISPTRYMTSGVPLIRTFQIKTPIANKQNLVFLAEKDHSKVFFKTELVPGDIVLTKIGAGIGDVALLPNNYTTYNFSQNVAGVSINRSKINPYYLLTFLISHAGRQQIIRYMMPSGQGKLELRDIKKIKVLRFKNHEDRIASFVQQAELLIQKSSTLYTQAKHLLEAELGLDKLKLKKPVGYTARFSDLEQSRRLDAQHFQPRFDRITNHLSGFDPKRVRDIRFYNRRGVQPVYVDDGSVDVVNSQHIGPQHIDYDGLQKTSEKVFAASPEGHIKSNDLLIYTTGAYIGRTNVYLSDQPALASNHVNILRLDSSIDAAYMALVFQSVIGHFQTQKHARGSAQAELYPADIDRFVVPILASRKQSAIGDLVRNSLEKQQESKRLLDQAKSSVEQLIEEATSEG